MTLDKLTSIQQLEQFLDGTQRCAYEVLSSKDEQYLWIQSTLVQFRYLGLNKADKGIVIRHMIAISGYSRQQMTRLINQYRTSGKIVRRQQARRGFTRRYTDADIRLLADMDALHQTPSGPVLKKLCERSHGKFNEHGYERLSEISVSHIYNLRATKTYKNNRRLFTKTQPKKSTIGERRKPKSDGKPGYLRVDTVHQGDQDKVKGVYHIDIVDEVTQFQVVCSVEKISELFMIPSLKAMMSLLPFKIRGFHTDNGSEYINKTVAKLLSKLHIEFTKSRSRKSNDNALVEGKNAAVIRKHFGYSHIAQEWASALNETIQEPLWHYQNFHRPCFFPNIEIDSKGKEIKKYPYENLMTPYDKLISLDQVERHLKPDYSIERLKEISESMSDNEAAKRLNQAKEQIFSLIYSENPKSA